MTLFPYVTSGGQGTLSDSTSEMTTKMQIRALTKTNGKTYRVL